MNKFICINGRVFGSVRSKFCIKHFGILVHTDNHWLCALKVRVNKDIHRNMTFFLSEQLQCNAIEYSECTISTTHFILQLGYRKVEFFE